MTKQMVIMDGNEAAASVTYRLSEIIAIYPITPASPMGTGPCRREAGAAGASAELPVPELSQGVKDQ